MSITAFPVLARILKERNLAATDVGVMAIACAAVDLMQRGHESGHNLKPLKPGR